MVAEIGVDHLEFLVIESLFGLGIEVGSEGVGGGSSTEQSSDEFEHEGIIMMIVEIVRGAVVPDYKQVGI